MAAPTGRGFAPAVLLVAVGFVLVNLAVDLLYRALDPRTRLA
jgi:ABC-type dipeptide/oligopeptide/nickel transport system permease component